MEVKNCISYGLGNNSTLGGWFEQHLIKKLYTKVWARFKEVRKGWGSPSSKWETLSSPVIKWQGKGGVAGTRRGIAVWRRPQKAL